MITAKFGTKKFEVSNKVIYTPNGLSFSEELNMEETEVSGKKPTVKVKGIKLQPLDFDVKLDARFVDVLSEIRYWKNTLLGKKSQNFSLGNYTIGKFFLTKVNVKEVTTNKSGVWTSAMLTLSFTEDCNPVATTTKTTTKAATNKAAAVKSSAVAQKKISIGSTIKPKSGVRWYKTAEGALKKSGTSGKAYQQKMTVKYTYSKNGKMVCVNPQGLGWLKVEDVTLVSDAPAKNSKVATAQNKLTTRK